MRLNLSGRCDLDGGLFLVSTALKKSRCILTGEETDRQTDRQENRPTHPLHRRAISPIEIDHVQCVTFWFISVADQSWNSI